MRRKNKSCLWLMFRLQTKLVNMGQIEYGLLSTMLSPDLEYILDMCVEWDNLMPCVLVSLSKEIIRIENTTGGVPVFSCTMIEAPTQGIEAECSERYTMAPNNKFHETCISQKGKSTSAEREVGCVFTGDCQKNVWYEEKSNF